MRYKGMVIRPPSEADSYLVQVTYGCSHNRCTFCGTYQEKPFRIRPEAEVMEDIALAGRRFPHTRRVFLCDGNALVLKTDALHRILDALHEAFPDLQRVGAYANARDIAKKTHDELTGLKDRKLGILYLGLESGDDGILEEVNKGATAADMIAAVKKAESAGFKTSVIMILGLGGKARSREHAKASARAVSAMNPRYFSCLMLMLVPGTPMFDAHAQGRFQLPGPRDLLQELRWLVEDLELTGTIFRANHASNYLPIGGRFPRDKDRLLKTIDAGLSGDVGLKPEFLRGL